MKIESKLLGFISMVVLVLLFACSGNTSQENTEEVVETETEETTEETAEGPGNVLYVVHDVNNYKEWKAGFDEHESARLENGLHRIGVAANQANENKIHLAFSVDDVEQAKAFASSDGLKQKMEELGVAGPPTMHFLETVYLNPDSIDSSERTIITHEISDFDSWKKVFDADEANRKEFGWSTRALLRGTDNPNNVVIIAAYNDIEQAKAMLSSEELKQKMQEAGVTSEPDIQFINWLELNED